jgi:hypothetical protein
MKYVKTYESFLIESISGLAMKKAHSKIDSLPKGTMFDDAKRIENLFNKSGRSWSEVIETLEKNKSKSRPTAVDIKDISITQPNIQANKVKKMIDSGNLPLIDVVQFEDGEMAIHDGHHRLTAAWALGENKIKVNLVKL